jgi:hypothetical protein
MAESNDSKRRVSITPVLDRLPEITTTQVLFLKCNLIVPQVWACEKFHNLGANLGQHIDNERLIKNRRKHATKWLLLVLHLFLLLCMQVARSQLLRKAAFLAKSAVC